MASFRQLPSGNWRVQVRQKGRYAAESFRRKKDAESWVSTRWSVPFEEAFQHVMDLANRFGVKVWRKDPLGLFPKSVRRASSDTNRQKS
jgi:hypothetical protein